MLFFLVGYAAPYWIRIKHPSGHMFYGVWLGVAPALGTTICGGVTDKGGWIEAVQGMQSACLIGLIVACVYASVENCKKGGTTSPIHYRFLEILIGISGLSGFIGCMVFVAMTEILMRQFLSWAFGLNLTRLLAMIIAVIIYGTNSAELSHPASPGNIYSASAPAPGGK
ncbi:hypothetical protein ACOMHN_011071 [Nucella lapillus]